MKPLVFRPYQVLQMFKPQLGESIVGRPSLGGGPCVQVTRTDAMLAPRIAFTQVYLPTECWRSLR